MSLTSKLHVGQANTHVSAIAFSSHPKVEFRFNNLQTTDGVNRLIDGITWQKGLTYIDRALQLAESDLFTAPSGVRSNVAKVRHYELRNNFLSVLDWFALFFLK